MEQKRLRVLLTEDDDGHATLIRRNLERIRLKAEIVRLRDGQETLAYLQRQFAGEIRSHPMLLLLDIRMPGIDGTEVLRQIKCDQRMRGLPVYILTTTDNPLEVDRCFELDCNAYVTKPVAYEAFTSAIERLCSFLEVSHLPMWPPESKDASA
jgi:CheY-like chemotaxis protein